jgi:hypothetical protein
MEPGEIEPRTPAFFVQQKPVSDTLVRNLVLSTVNATASGAKWRTVTTPSRADFGSGPMLAQNRATLSIGHQTRVAQDLYGQISGFIAGAPHYPAIQWKRGGVMNVI